MEETGVKFNAREFADALENIGRKANAQMVNGYIVDGKEVGVGELETYIRTNGGESIEVIY